MIRYVINSRLEHPPAQVYDFVVVRQPENHPRWEKEVIELRRDGPLAPGTRGVMVRRDFGKVTEQKMEWLEVVPERRVRFVSDHNGVRFDLALDLAPAGSGTDLRTTVEITLSGTWRWFGPLLAVMFKRNSLRIMNQLRQVMAEQGAA